MDEHYDPYMVANSLIVMLMQSMPKNVVAATPSAIVRGVRRGR